MLMGSGVKGYELPLSGLDNIILLAPGVSFFPRKLCLLILISGLNKNITGLI
jgi:hypothetical protein